MIVKLQIAPKYHKKIIIETCEKMYVREAMLQTHKVGK